MTPYINSLFLTLETKIFLPWKQSTSGEYRLTFLIFISASISAIYTKQNISQKLPASRVLVEVNKKRGI